MLFQFALVSHNVSRSQTFLKFALLIYSLLLILPIGKNLNSKFTMRIKLKTAKCEHCDVNEGKSSTVFN